MTPFFNSIRGTQPVVSKDEIRPLNHRLKPRFCARFTSSRTAGKLEVGRSNSRLPLTNCRLSRNGRANTFKVWAAFLTSGLSARYSTIVSWFLMLNSLNTDLETASLSYSQSISSIALSLARRSFFSRSSISILVAVVLSRLRYSLASASYRD